MNTTNNEVIDFPDYSTGELCETTQQQLNELLEQEEFQEELARKKQRKKTIVAISAALGAVIIGIAGITAGWQDQ